MTEEEGKKIAFLFVKMADKMVSFHKSSEMFFCDKRKNIFLIFKHEENFSRRSVAE